MPECISQNITNAEILERLKNSEKNTAFLKKSTKRLQQDYEDRYVAILNGKVIDSNKDIEKLRISLTRDGVDITEVLIEFIYSDKVIWVL